jgi:hypothetical protein
MKVFQRQQNLTGIKPRPLSSKQSLLNMPHQIPTGNILHYKIDSGLCLKASVQVDEEREFALVCNKEDAFFGLDGFDFIVFENEFLFQDFDGVERFGGYFFGEHHLYYTPFSVQK